MEQVVHFFQHYGVAGLLLVSFLESFCSPVLPDLLLVPLAVANPQKAIYYSLLVTLASVLGGVIGYWLGKKLGIPLAKKIIPERYIKVINGWLEKYGGWAIFLFALAPIPYKFVSISAGVFKINMTTFIIASILGRAKRFLLIGILIYYHGPKAVEAWQNGLDSSLIWLIVGLIVIAVLLVAYKRFFLQKFK